MCDLNDARCNGCKFKRNTFRSSGPRCVALISEGESVWWPFAPKCSDMLADNHDKLNTWNGADLKKCQTKGLCGPNASLYQPTGFQQLMNKIKKLF